MRHGGRPAALLAALSLLPALAEAPARLGYGTDLVADAPLSLDRDANGVPDAWAEIREKGFRAYPGSIRISREGSLEIRLNGRTVGIETLKGIPVQAGTGYRIEGRCRSSGMKAGAPELGIRWLDAEGRELERETRPLPRGEAWTRFTAAVSSVPPLARSAALRLVARGTEVSGSVHFEGVRMFREPRFEVTGFAPGHLQALPGPVTLTLSIGGLDAGRYVLSGEMLDMDGSPGPWRWRREMDLPAGVTRLPVEVDLRGPGAFRLRFTLSSAGEPVAVREAPLGVIGPLPSAPDAGAGEEGRPLGMLGAWISPGEGDAGAVTALVERLAPCAAAVEIRPPDSRSAAWGQHPADILLRRLVRQGVRCIGLLEAAPEGSSAHRAAILRYLEEVDDWAFRVGPRKPWEAARKQWESIASWASTLPRPTRWGAALEEASGLSGAGGAPFSFALLPDGPETEAPVDLWRVVRLPEGAAPGERVRDLALRGLGEAFAGRSVFLVLDAAPGGLLEPDGSASPEFLAWRTLSHILRGARDLGSLPLGPGIEARVIRRGSEAAIVAWTTDPGRTASVLIPTAAPVTSVGLMGDVGAVDPSDGKAALEIGGLPRCFLVSSAGWLRTRRTMRLDGPVGASAAPSERILSFENGFDTPLSGVLTLAPPRGWRITPSILPVSVPRGATFRARVRLQPWGHETTGVAGREMTLGATLSYAEGGGGSMEIQVPFRFEPQGISARFSTAYLSDRGQVRITQQVLNSGSTDLACDAFVSVRGAPERRKPVGRLAPGEARVVEHLLPWTEIQAGEALVGIREVSGAGRFLVEGLTGP